MRKSIVMAVTEAGVVPNGQLRQLDVIDGFRGFPQIEAYKTAVL
jgi:hypothetical protein